MSNRRRPLPNICSSYFEATLFASILHYHYLAVLRIEKKVQSEISDHTLEVDAICILNFRAHPQKYFNVLKWANYFFNIL
jgi:hypothetical protein